MNDSVEFLVVADCDLLRSFTISVLERRGVPCRPVVRLQDTIALAESGGYVGAVIFSNSASKSSLDDTNVAETLATRFGLVVFMSDPDRDGLRIEPTKDQGILFRLPSPLRFKDFSLIAELYRATTTVHYSL